MRRDTVRQEESSHFWFHYDGNPSYRSPAAAMDGRPDRMIAGSVALRASRQNLFMIDLPPET